MKNDNMYNSEYGGGGAPQEEINLKDILINVFKYRVWFLLSVIVCVAVGTLYVMSRPNIYSRSATVIVKDDRRGGSVSEAAVFQEIFSMGGTGSVYNEIGLFESNRLMYDVVDRLGLEISYRSPQRLRSVDLYGVSPIKAEFSDILPNQYISFTITMLSPQQAQVSDLTFYASKSGAEDIILEDRVVNLGTPVVTPYGSFVITPTLFMEERYINTPINILRRSPRETARAYRKKISVTLIDKFASLVTIATSDESVARAEDVINTLIEVYSDDAINDKNRMLTNTASFIEERLAIIEADLTAVDAEIEGFKRDHNLTDVASEGSMYLESRSRIDQANLNILNQISMAQYMKEYLLDENNISELLPVNIGIGETGLQAQIAEYNKYMSQRNKLIYNSSENNPLVIDYQNVLTQMRASVLSSVDNLIKSLEIQAQNFAKREDESLDRIKDIPTQQKYIASIERQQTIKEQLYLYLLNKKEESELQQSINTSNCRIVDFAEGVMQPIAPNKKLIVLFSFIIGLLIPAAVIYISGLFNTTVKTRKDIKAMISAPFLGDIPSEKENKMADNKLVVSEGSRTPINESFKIIRDNIDFMSPKNPNGGTVIQLTSHNPASGKTFVTINMAMSMALSGSKAVIVDLDIRKGSLSRVSGMAAKTTVGATQYLMGKVTSLKDITYSYADDAPFDIIPAGALPPNPAELLKGGRLEILIDELRKSYDYILIDNPPYGMVVDAAICSRLCDQSIYVMRAGKFDKRFMPDVEELYENNKLPNMSILLNGVDMSLHTYGYGYGYGIVENKSFLRKVLGI